MKFSLNVLGKRGDDGARRAPSHLFGGRVRTSTVVLIIVFLAVWWTYDTYRPEPAPPRPAQVVPPGFVPDPDYTWVPRERVAPPVTTRVRPTPTTTAPTTEPTTTTTTTSAGPPPPPCLLPPPFCPASTTPSTPTPSQLPQPGPGPPPSSTPPAS
ncbi:hypothetical protein LAUMK13_01308 [Mycobacterium innocens]|uniref:Proline rich protein n=1 Tax=Mycobacterium innocens TaxID=2341083 RepID=A0A498PVN2_9MYCO|nr:MULTISPECIES: hypothetical protein [Mycobacterium]VBA36754.1 hypothetical protein LAUMK13_01308 [Mycobacterium innocens]